MAPTDLDRLFATLAAAQEGVASLAQARLLGFTEGSITHRRRSGRWPLVLPGVVRLPGAPTSPQSTLIAGLLLLGDRAVASHRSAAALHGLEGFRLDTVEFTARSGRHHFTPLLRVHSTSRLEPLDVTSVRRDLPPGTRRDRSLRRARPVTHLPATSPSRTIIDLAWSEPADVVSRAIDSAVRHGLTSPSYLADRLADLRGRGRRGVRLLDVLLDDSGGHSWLERRFLRLVREAGLPRPDTQVVVRASRRFVARVDFLFRPQRLVVEVSGRLGHTSEPDRRRDSRRRNELQSLGYRVIEFTTGDVVGEPARVIAELICHLGPF